MKKQNKKEAAKRPRPLTKKESEILEDCFYLPGWQFDSVIKPKCTLVKSYYIGGEMQEGNWSATSAYLYGLLGVDSKTNESLCATFFLRLEGCVFQLMDPISADKLLSLMRKEFEYDKYQRGQFEKKRSAEAAK